MQVQIIRQILHLCIIYYNSEYDSYLIPCLKKQKTKRLKS